MAGTQTIQVAAQGRPMPILWRHDPGRSIGRWTRVHEDEQGVLYEGQRVPEEQKGEGNES
ncbi:hypothetical protein ASD15_21965 [Massilia sp. Root351]|nr:hypothetical protein ASD15_21965 [Massilia sp. Root351]